MIEHWNKWYCIKCISTKLIKIHCLYTLPVCHIMHNKQIKQQKKSNSKYMQHEKEKGKVKHKLKKRKRGNINTVYQTEMVSKKSKIESKKGQNKTEEMRSEAMRSNAYPLITFFQDMSSQTWTNTIQPAECCQIKISI